MVHTGYRVSFVSTSAITITISTMWIRFMVVVLMSAYCWNAVSAANDHMSHDDKVSRRNGGIAAVVPLVTHSTASGGGSVWMGSRLRRNSIRGLKSPKAPKSPKSPKSPKAPKSPKCKAPLNIPELPPAPVLIPTVTVGTTEALKNAIDSAVDGNVIFLENGEYNFDVNLVIDKEIALVGESQDGVKIIDDRGNSQSFVQVSADNVVLKDLTINHASTDPFIGCAIVATGPDFPQTRIDNFRMYNVQVEQSKCGLGVRSDNFIVQGCTFEVVGGSGTRRGIIHYGNGGASFIKDNVFINESGNNLIAIYLTSSTGTNPNEVQLGSLVIEGSTFPVGTGLFQFVVIDNHQGDPDSFELIVLDNETPESNAFLVSFGVVDNFGDVFSRIVLVGNMLTNENGKGGIAIDGASGPLEFRSTILDVLSKDNELGQLEFRSDWAEALGSQGSIVGYATEEIIQPTVNVFY